MHRFAGRLCVSDGTVVLFAVSANMVFATSGDVDAVPMAEGAVSRAMDAAAMTVGGSWLGAAICDPRRFA